MKRKEQFLAEQWDFWLGEKENTHKETVDLPHDWVIGEPVKASRRKKGDFSWLYDQCQGFRSRRDIGWYQKSILLQVHDNHRYFLDFDGIYENSTVWVNGIRVGGHKFGYTPFRLEITKQIKDGENIITVRVDSTAVPTDRWYTGAGIYRNIRLIETGQFYLDEREIKVLVTIDNEKSNAHVEVKTGTDLPINGYLAFQNQNLSAKGQHGVLHFNVKEPALWNAENPQLYQLSIGVEKPETETDIVSLKIGLRDIQFSLEEGLLINGVPTKLKGVCLHQDVGCRGSAAKKEIWKERLTLLKNMGCNAIRAAHHMHSSDFMDLCDEMGFYVYEECFDKWVSGHYGIFFETEWKNDLDAMIKRDRNRPSVIIWGVGNEVENQGQESMLKLLKMLADRARELDQSRPVTYAMNPHFKREANIDLSQIKDVQQFVDEADDTEIWDVKEKIQRIKRISEFVDILSCNYQEQWYEQIHKEIPNKLILGTEIYQYFKGHSEQFKNFTQYPPALIPDKYAYVIGGMVWAGIDYLGESMGYPAKGWNGALIRTNNQYKTGYYILQSYWSKKPMVHFSVMDYSLEDEGVKDHWDIPMYAHHWHFPQFHNTVIPYMIASNCEDVKVFVNDSRIYVKRPAEYENRLITGFLPWLPGKVTVIGYNNGEEVCREEIRTPGPAVALAFEETNIFLPASNGYQKLLSLHAVDEEGTPCFRESAKIRFRAEGPVKILAVDNGDAKSLEPYQADTIHLYHGCASVMVALTGTEGRSVIYADAEGMRSGTAVISITSSKEK